MISNHIYTVDVYPSSPATNILREKNLIFVPMSHIFGIGMTLFGMGAGSCNLIMKGFNPVIYLETIAKLRVN